MLPKTASTLLFAVSAFESLVEIFLGMALFILARDYGASPFEISILLLVRSLSYVVSIFSGVIFRRVKRPDILFLLVGITSKLPIVSLLFVKNSVPFFIVAVSMYSIMSKSLFSYWTEMIRRIFGAQRISVVSKSLAISYIEGVIVGPIFGYLLDAKLITGFTMFGITGLLSMLEIPFRIIMFKLFGRQVIEENLNHENKKVFDLFNTLLLLRHKNVAAYHSMFVILGFSVWAVRVAFPVLLAELGDIVSYTSLSYAILIARGIGFYFGSNVWASCLEYNGIFYTFAGLSLFGSVYSSLMFTLLVFPRHHNVMLFVAYAVNGLFISGSKMLWVLSPTMLCGSEDSVPYTELSMIVRGVRDVLLGALLGWIINVGFGVHVFMVAVLCFLLCIGLCLRLRSELEI